MQILFYKNSIGKRVIASVSILSFLITGVFGFAGPVVAQEFLLPQPGALLNLSPAFTPPLLKGVKVYSDNPFRLDFILDKGNSKESIEDLKAESTRLIKYFLASVTVPENDLWVNLSPYEKDRIIPNAFGVTEMGRDLLAQDYILKQLTASVIYPEEKIGKEFWDRVYEEARKRYGTADIPIDTFNKVWIVPAKATVYETKDSAYVVESRLKVLLEEDYLALEKGTTGQSGKEKAKESNKLGSDIVREIVIPILEKEVNEGKNFVQLRQVYQSLILAIWFKDKIRESLFGKVYVDQEKTGGVDIADKAEKNKIWERYVEAFKKGAYNYIKEDYDPTTQEVVARKYFSGGAGLDQIRKVYGKTKDRSELPEGVSDRAMIVESNFAPKFGDNYQVPVRKGADSGKSYGYLDGGYLRDRRLIQKLINRVTMRSKQVVSADLTDKIVNIFAETALYDLLALPSSFFKPTDNEEQALINRVIQEAGLFYNFAVDENNQRIAVDVALDPSVMERMGAARQKFTKEYPNLVEITRHYWEEELPHYKGDVFEFNQDIAAKRPVPKASVAIISMVGRRFDAIMRRMDELNQVNFKEGIELVISIADPENLDVEKWEQLKGKISMMGYPVKVVFSKKAVDGEMNSITIDRNLCSSLSKGSYQIFIDDDVKLVGPVIESLVGALESHPELGIVSLPNYDRNFNLLKPVYPRKYYIDDHLMIADRVLGNITATRREIVKILPFNPFLRNLGDDIHFVRQILLLGYLTGYTLPDDSYAMDENLGYSATRTTKNLSRFLVQEGLVYYFSPETYDENQAGPAAFLVNRWASGILATDFAYDFWAKFRMALLVFLNGPEKHFNFIEQYGNDEFVKENLLEVEKAVAYYETNKSRLIAFKVTQYDPKNFSKVNPSTGPLIITRSPLAPRSADEVVDIISARKMVEFKGEGFDIALEMFHAGVDPADVLSRLAKVEGIDDVIWEDGVLTITTKTEVVKFHPKDDEINERLGLKDRFYVRHGDIRGQIAVKIYRRDNRDERRKKNGPVYVLGVLRPGHDSGAALIKDGVLVGAIEEERLNLDKHTTAYFPQEAVRYLLESNGLSWQDIDHIAIPYDYNFYRETPSSREPHYHYRQKHALPFKDSYRRYDTEQFQSFLEDTAFSYGTGYIPPVTFVKHHKAHAAAAYYASGFREPTLVVSIDGQGEDESTTIWLAKEGKLRKVARTTPFTHSLGHFYHIFTVYLGYRRNDEGKVMGYAPYGVPRNSNEEKAVTQLREMMHELIRFNRETGQVELNKDDFKLTKESALPGVALTADFLQRLAKIVPPMPEGKTGRDLKPEDRGRAHLAYVMQERVEQVISDMVSYYLNEYKETRGTKYVVMAGGLALNIVSNGKLIENGIVEADKFFVPAYPADDGTMVGAALSVSDENYGISVQHEIKKISFGKTYSDDETRKTLTSFNLIEGVDYDYIVSDEDLVSQVTKAIAADKTVAWFQGGAELGPRALGNRSILNRLDDPEGNLKVNRIKNREPWRPSALSMKEEEAAKFLEGVSTSPFMTIAFPVTTSKKDIIKAGAHAEDGSTRPQTVSREANPLYWSLLGEMGARTGVPGVLNTSFNRSGPIVENPEDALNTYYYGEGLDLLAIGHFIVKRKDGISPSILNGRDESSLRNFFKSGAYKSLAAIEAWDEFWITATRLAQTRAASNQHYLVVSTADVEGGREILRVPLIKEMFQAGTREYMIADLARRIQHGIGNNSRIATIAIETTAPQFEQVIRGLFERFAPDDIRRQWHLVSLGFGQRSPPKIVQNQRLLDLVGAARELDDDINQWETSRFAAPILVAVTGPDKQGRASLISHINSQHFVIDGQRWAIPTSQKSVSLSLPFADIQYNDYVVALEALTKGKTAMIPLGQSLPQGAAPQVGFVIVGEEERQEYKSLLVKEDSVVWVRYDGQLFEELRPQSGDVFIVNSSVALTYPILRSFFKKSYFVGNSRESDGLAEVLASGTLPAEWIGASFADVLVHSDAAMMSSPLSKTPWIPLSLPTLVRHIDKICVALTNLCPVGCLFCFMESVKDKRRAVSLDTKAIDKILAYIKQNKIDRILLSGGEPLTEMGHVLKVIREVEAPYVTIFTSGFFAKTAAGTEHILDQLADALKERRAAGLPPINILFEVSHDAFHARNVGQENIVNIIRAFEQHSTSRYAGITLEVKGVMDEGDPIPELIRRLNGTVESVEENDSFPTRHVALPSGYKFTARYSEVKLLKKMLGTGLAARKFEKVYSQRLNQDVIYMGRGENNGVALSVNYDGVLSINDYLAKSLVLGNVNDDDFFADAEARFSRDPLVIALREIGLNAVLGIAAKIRPDIHEHSIATNNQFVAVSDILEDEKVRDYVYKELVKLFENNGRLPVSLLEKDAFVIGNGRIELSGPATVKGSRNQIRFQGDEQEGLLLRVGNGLVLEDAFLSLRRSIGLARVPWQGDTRQVDMMAIGDNVSIINGGEVMNVPYVGNNVNIDGSVVIEMDDAGVGDRAKILGNSEVRMSSVGEDVVIDQQSKVFKAKISAGATVINSSLIGGQDELVGEWRSKDEEGRGRGVVIGQGAEFRNGLAHHQGAQEGKVNPIIVADGVKLDGVFLIAEHNEGIRVESDLQLEAGKRVYVFDGVVVESEIKQQIQSRLASFNIVEVRMRNGFASVEGVSGDLITENLLNVQQLKREYAIDKTKGIPKVFSIETIQEARDINQILRESDVFVSRQGEVLMSREGREDIAIRIGKGTFVYPGVEFYVNADREVDVNVWDLGNRGGALIIADKRNVHLGPYKGLAGRIVGAVIRDVNVNAEFNNFGGVADNIEGNAKITIRNQGILINANLFSDNKGRGEIIWGDYQGRNVDIEIWGDTNVALSHGGIIEGRNYDVGLHNYYSIKITSGFVSGYRSVLKDDFTIMDGGKYWLGRNYMSSRTHDYFFMPDGAAGLSRTLVNPDNNVDRAMLTERGITELMRAAYAGNIKDIKTWIESDDVNARSEKGNTALMVACGAKQMGFVNQGERKEIVELLIAKGALINAKNDLGFPALAYAVFYQLWDIVDVLIAHGADGKIGDKFGINAVIPFEDALVPVRDIKTSLESLVKAKRMVDKIAEDKAMISDAVRKKQEASSNEFGRQDLILQGLLSEGLTLEQLAANEADIRKKLIANKQAQGQSIFINVPLQYDNRLKSIYGAVQDKIAGFNVGDRVNMALDEIHLTIATPETGKPDDFILDMDSVFRDAQTSARDKKPFNVKLIGPHLMPSGAVVMEFEVLSQEFVDMRASAETLSLDRKNSFKGNNRPSNPNIYHSTVTILTDPELSKDKKKLAALAKMLDEERASLTANPVIVSVDRIAVSRLDNSTRKFIEPAREIVLDSGIALNAELFSNQWKKVENARRLLTVPVSDGAKRMFDDQGNPRSFKGMVVGEWVNEQRMPDFYKRLADFRNVFLKKIEEAGLSSSFIVHTTSSVHLSIQSLLTGEQTQERYDSVRAAVSEAFREIEGLGISAPKFKVQGITAEPGLWVGLALVPASIEDQKIFDLIKKKIQEETGIPASDYIPHMTLAFQLKDMSKQDYEKLYQVLSEFQGLDIGEFILKQMDLRQYSFVNTSGPATTDETNANAGLIKTVDLNEGNPGGIDLTRDKMNIQTRGSGDSVHFNFDPAMIQQLQNASGLTPVIINIYPMTTTVPMFLGLRDDAQEMASVR